MCRQQPENEPEQHPKEENSGMVDVELGKFTSIDESLKKNKEGLTTYCKVLIAVVILMVILGIILLVITLTMQEQTEWPQCLGMDGDACCDFITQKSSDVKNCYVIPEGSFTIKNYDLSRVWVVVEESTNMVTKIPGRG
mmetsp:Transcript_20292/g.30519  ORF Transcript_20292/g.30519 Transcript_20292/m.30519 type:complete len:139 (+) Transcript_20292:93-509(+)|eukprot:CAMPEP_0178925162 /NCGR_PEP_ID=MMETSP0786-20121207/17748_1 /TAXON_ID=186022 /ORGANISM="Thalassionema frauenfeldii, Strain CCMP 1798" /LENGTH=138 /DNA_ID=CAMNT_0020599991 /DNA_START=45 /DNA_END=461 /DNA_ORIENTATION=-